MSYKKCARDYDWPYPYWCKRNLGHDGPCALRRRWLVWLLEK